MEDKAVKLIKAARKARLWSVRRLAREAGISAAYVSQIESGARPLTPRATAKIADAFGIPPYSLLAEAGFIPGNHVAKAREMAERAQKETRAGKGYDFDWLVADYLFVLGDYPYGVGKESGAPVPPSFDWRELDPDAPPTIGEHARQWVVDHAKQPKPTVPPIEGWEDLSEANRAFVQQMVNKLRGSATGE